MTRTGILGIAALVILAGQFALAGEGDWVAEANNALGMELYAQLAGKPGNLFFSPNSIETCLAMTFAGARGETAAQMAQVLHLPGVQGLHKDLGSFVRALNAPNGPDGKPRRFQLSVANRLWGQKGYNLNPAFLALTKENYGAGLEELDFLNQTEPSRLTINGWVEKQTQEKIKDLIPPGLLQKDTRLILTNAIYFKGNWSLQFSKAKTQELPFKRGQGEAVNCSLMSSRSRYGYMENESVQGLRMPYAGGELAMIILLPKTADGLPTLERQLTPANLAGWVGKLVDDEVFVWIPRFKLTSAFQLSGALQALGMRDAFAYGKADFSAIEPKKELFIGEVLHKAFVDVNEEGTEAAAATAVVMRAGAPPHAMPPPKIFRADHPFIFMIRHEKTGAMLFMGRLSDPSA